MGAVCTDGRRDGVGRFDGPRTDSCPSRAGSTPASCRPGRRTSPPAEARSPGARVAAALAMAALTTGMAIGPAGPAGAGAWMFEKGDGVAIVTTAFSKSTKSFDENGRLQPIPLYEKFELRAHIEYGLTPWLTGVFKTEGRLESQETTVDVKGVDGLGARVRVAGTERSILSAQLIAYSPGLDRNGLIVESEPAALDARILFGRSFEAFGRPAFVDAQAAYRLSQGGENDELHLDLTLGLKPTPKWLLMAQSFSTFSTGQDAPYRYHKVEASVLRRIARGFGVQLGATATVAGVSALQEQGVFAALWYEF